MKDATKPTLIPAVTWAILAFSAGFLPAAQRDKPPGKIDPALLRIVALLFEENMNYGFRRNLWALKPVALCIDLLAIIAIGGHAWWARGTSNPTALPDVSTLIALGITALHLLIMLAVVTKGWVKTTAEAYARQLLAACDAL